MNIQTTQLLSKVKYPRTWEEVQAFVLQDKYFIISANAKGKSHLLIYGIEKDSLQPLKTFVFSGKIKILQQMNEQFVIMTELPASEQHIQALIKQGSGSLAYFPKVTTARNYGFEETQLSQMECATLAHHLTSQDPASFFMLIKLNIDALDLDPEVHYLFGHLDAVAVGNEYFYLLKNQEWPSTLVQKFAIDPKIFEHSQVVFSGSLLEKWGVEFRDNQLQVFTKQSSGNTKQYLLSTREEGKKEKSQIIQITTESFDRGGNDGSMLVLENITNKKIQSFSQSGWNFQAEELLNLDGMKRVFEGAIIEVKEQGEVQVSFSQNIWANPSKLSFVWEKIQTTPYRYPEHKLLILVTKKQDATIVRGVEVTPEKELSIRFARKYTQFWAKIELQEAWIFDRYAVLQFWNFLDNFMLSNSQQMKVMKLK